MDQDDFFEITIADDEYWETYSLFNEEKGIAEEKIKRGILKIKGLTNKEINSVIDSLEIVTDGADGYGVDGGFDDQPYTPIRLVKRIYREPPEPVVEMPEEEPEPKKEARQVMLKQYYGDKESEDRRRKIFDRYKSHIVKKEKDTYDENGNKRKIEVYTVEDYPQRESDSDELLIDGYKTRLERLSRAHQGDFSPYERRYKKMIKSALIEITEKYEEMHKVNPEEAEKFKKTSTGELENLKSNPEFKHEAIQALIDGDTEFIETNNYGYNSRQNTQENLRTLGKHGEKSVRAQVSDQQAFYQKAGLHVMNTLIEIRNHTVAPVNKAVGTFVAAPIHRVMFGVSRAKSVEPVSVNGYLITPMDDMIATSQKHSVGMFKNKPSHRYEARKDYFIEQEKEAMGEKYDKKDGTKEVKRTTLGKLIRFAVVPRIKAITQYEDGNVAVLNAGLHDIEKATQERKTEMVRKRSKLIATNRRIIAYDKEIEELGILLKTAKDPIRKTEIEKTIEMRKKGLLVHEGRAIEIKNEEIDSVQTDAISVSEHDKANKANMTKVVTAVKTAGRVVVGKMIGDHLYREVAKKSKTPDTYQYIPGESKQVTRDVVRKQLVEEPGMDTATIGDITLEDIYSRGSGKLSYHYGKGGNLVNDNSNFFRGAAFKYKGKLMSGSDGKGFDIAGRTDVLLDQKLDGQTRLADVVQEILQDKTGGTFTIEQVDQMIATGEIADIDIWRSALDTGIPTGWLNSTKIIPQIIAGGTHTREVEIVETIVETITTPGRYKLIPGVETTSMVQEINPVVVGALTGLAAAEVNDFNDVARYTRSMESIHRRQPKVLSEMKKENDKKREQSGKKVKETNEPEKPKKSRDIKSFQRNNKSKKRYYVTQSYAMHEATEKLSEKQEGVTVFDGFTGTKKGDLASGYDENAIGVNNREEGIEER